MAREKGYVKIRIKDEQGRIKTIRIKGRARALSHPLRVNRKGKYIDARAAGNYLLARQEGVKKRKARRELAASSRADADATPAEAAAAVGAESDAAEAGADADADVVGAGPLRVVEREPSGRAGATYSTWFRAMGSTGTLKDMGGKSPDLLREDLEDAAAPAGFYSNQSGILGQVKWEGIIPLESLIDSLNFKLQFAGEESDRFDFRRAYRSWSYRYQVIERIGQLDRVILEIRDSSGRHR